MKQCRVVPVFRSVVVLGLVSAGLTSAAVAQSPQVEESASSSSSALVSSLFTPMLPSAPGIAQPLPSVTKVRSHQRVETSLSLGAFAQLTTTRTGIQNGTEFTVAAIPPEAGTLGTFRQTFSPWLGYTINFGYSRTTANYHFQPTIGTSTFNPYFVHSNTYEVTTAYVVHTSLKHRLQGFAELGGGVLAFLPTSNNPSLFPSNPFFHDSTTVRPAGLGVFGVDYQFSEHLGLRAEYRGLLYKQPDFGLSELSGFRYYTVSSEPTISLTYTFGKKKYRR